MAFLGNVAFRELIDGYGGYGLLFTEMCSAKRIPGENRHRSTYFKWRDDELPLLVCQIFGADPGEMAAAARLSLPNFRKLSCPALSGLRSVCMLRAAAVSQVCVSGMHVVRTC